MSNHSQNEALNDLLIEIGRSFLQYVGECWPWTAGHSAETRASVDQLVERQKADVAALADFLTASNHPVDFGTYPTDYTSLHFVDLDYLLETIVQNQSSVLEATREAADAATGSETVNGLVSEIVESETAILSGLKQLAGTE